MKNYITLNMVQVSQLQSGLVFTGKITFRELNQIYKLTERKEKIDDPFGEESIELKKHSQEFQRQLSQKKLREIEKYLKNEFKLRHKEKSLAMFPSSLILYNKAYELDDIKPSLNFKDNDELNEEIIKESYTPNLHCCFYLKNEIDHDGLDIRDLYKVYIPRNKNITLIVDGQHRFIGTQRFFKSSDEDARKEINDFEFIVTFLVGFDIYEVGQIFATVNFNQKPVNRSLYYDIFGSSPQTDRDGNLQNDIRLAHELAVHLQNNESSPINGMIKLLGKGYGLISQAFFVDKMIRFVFRKNVWDSLIADYMSGKSKSYVKISKFMKAYFSALKEAYPSSWPSKVTRDELDVYSSYSYSYILCKTTGLGAYFRLIKDIYPIVEADDGKFKENILKIFNRISDAEAKKLFSKNGPYGGAGSEGNQVKLYKYLKEQYKLKTK